MIKKKIISFRYKFRYPFHIHHGIRTHTNAIILQLDYKGHIAYGECPLPPYLEETTQSVSSFLYNINLPNSSLDNIEKYTTSLLSQYPSQTFAIACLDIALTNLKLKLAGKSSFEYFNKKKFLFPQSLTLGFSTKEEMKSKIDENKGIELFKLKLGSSNDFKLIDIFCSLSSKPFFVDANQGWKDIGFAKEITHYLKQKGALLIEQPFNKLDLKKHKELKTHSQIPIIADESLQNINDLPIIKDSFDGINIKLMKCGGIHPAIELLKKANEYNLSILIGCMSGGLFEYNASIILANQSDWVDLDGLSLNDLCELD